MLYSFQHNFLFNHISRTGGVAIQNCLQDAGATFKVLGAVQHSPLCEARSQLDDLFDEALKFAIVRNPWDRLVSWYAYILKTNRGFDSDAVKDPASREWRGFDAYLESILDERVEVDGVMRRSMSQYHQLSDAQETLLVDSIGRFESLEIDFSALMKRLNFRHPPLKKMNASVHENYQQYYSAAGQELVADCLAKDIEVFAYEF